MWLRCWLPFRWELRQATVSTAGRDQRYADHPHCVTRDGMQQQQRGVYLVHVCPVFISAGGGGRSE